MHLTAAGLKRHTVFHFRLASRWHDRIEDRPTFSALGTGYHFWEPFSQPPIAGATGEESIAIEKNW